MWHRFKRATCKILRQMIGTKALTEHRQIGRVHGFFSRQTCSLHLNGESEGKIVILMELRFRPEPLENVLFFFSHSLHLQLLLDVFFTEKFEGWKRKKKKPSFWLDLNRFLVPVRISAHAVFSLICVSCQPPSLTCHLHSRHSFSDVRRVELQENNTHGCLCGRINKEIKARGPCSPRLIACICKLLSLITLSSAWI